MTDLSYIKNIEELSRFFGFVPKNFLYLRKNKHSLVKKIYIHKKSGGVRLVYYATDNTYRGFLKKLLFILNEHYNPPSCVHGFVKGKSCYTNASQHTNKKMILNVDIKDFFLNIGLDKISPVLQSLGLKQKHAQILSDLITVNDNLATGLATSPTIANMVCADLDTDFEALAKKYRATYTRYSDDITLSSNASLPEKNEIQSILRRFNFQINHKKYKLRKRDGSQYVTGLTVCDTKPHIPRKIKKNLRLELHYMKKFGSSSHCMYHIKNLPLYSLIPPQSKLMFGKVPPQYCIPGWIAYIRSVDKQFAIYMSKMVNEIKSRTDKDELITSVKKK